MPKPETHNSEQVVPKQELEKRSRRVFTSEYKLSIIRQADATPYCSSSQSILRLAQSTYRRLLFSGRMMATSMPRIAADCMLESRPAGGRKYGVIIVTACCAEEITAMITDESVSISSFGPSLIQRANTVPHVPSLRSGTIGLSPVTNCQSSENTCASCSTTGPRRQKCRSAVPLCCAASTICRWPMFMPPVKPTSPSTTSILR